VDELNGGPVQSSERFYLINLIAVTPTTFTLQALPDPASPQINDVSCTEFQLTNSGLQTAFGATADPTRDCW
jgi:Tfp pilus assembly protein PilE